MKILVSFLVMLPLAAFGQVYNDFEISGLQGWIQSPAGQWGIDSASPLSGRFSLWHCFDNSEAGSAQAAVRLMNLKPDRGTIKWSFQVRHGCDPSSSNNWSVFLMSDAPASEMKPGGKVNGYAAGVNFTGYDDTLRVWKIKNGSAVTVVKTDINWQAIIGTTQPATIFIERTPGGVWSIKIILPGGEEKGVYKGIDNEIFEVEWFGIFYRYTSTRDRLLWFDNLIIDGPFFQDTEPPQPVSCTIKSRRTIELIFNEKILPGFLNRSNFLLNSTFYPVDDAQSTGTLSYLLNFDSDFINRQPSELLIKNLCDRDSNCISDLAISFIPLWAEHGDVVISEIMADPTPAVSLPVKEYLEITSRSEQPISLKGWALCAEGQKSYFPDVTINNGDYIILCSVADTGLFKQYGSVVGLKSFPALTDSGKCLWIADSSGVMIHGIEYNSSWYGDRMKAEGGWSLEMIDISCPFNYEGNWKASVSPSGGTPGRPNSVLGNYTDRYFEGITNVFPADSFMIKVSFSEPVKNFERLREAVRINGKVVNSIQALDPLQREFIIIPSEPFVRRRQYTLTLLDDVTDYAGNRASKNSFIFGLPEPVTTRDVVFNELLFNSLPGDADFIEFYNVSDKIIDISSLSVASGNIKDGTVSSSTPLSEKGRCLLPGAYYAITTDRKAVVERYFSSDEKNIFNVPRFPSMPDDEGHLILFNKSLEVVDEAYYSEKQHFALLTSVEGVSLEKIMPQAESSSRSNWYSASESSGWGTPGARNSVFTGKQSDDQMITLSSSRLTPDNDGEEDLLVISFSFPGTGNVVSVIIFDENGSEVKRLATNYFIGSEGMLVWDGTASDGSVVRRGIYIIYISSFDNKGKTGKWKKVCSVLR